MQTLKDLPFQLLDLPIPEVTYEFKSIEVKEFGFRTDGLIIPGDSESPLILVEAQMQPDPDLYYRISLELLVYLRQYRPANPWQVLVIYPDQVTEREIPQGDKMLAFANIHRVYLNELSDTRSFGMKLLRLVIAEPEIIPEAGRNLVAELQGFEPLLRQRCLELITEIINRKFSEMREEEIRRMLELAELEQTRAYEQGREQGREQGQEEGRHQEGLSLVIRLLTRQCGPIPPEVQAQIQALSLEQIGDLGEALLDFSELGDLNNWLQKVLSMELK